MSSIKELCLRLADAHNEAPEVTGKRAELYLDFMISLRWNDEPEVWERPAVEVEVNETLKLTSIPPAWRQFSDWTWSLAERAYQKRSRTALFDGRDVSNALLATLINEYSEGDLTSWREVAAIGAEGLLRINNLGRGKLHEIIQNLHALKLLDNSPC